LWAVAVGVVAAAAWGMRILWGLEPALQWGLQAAAVLAYVLIRMGTALERNHHPQDSRLRPHIGAANGLTLSRAVLIAALAGSLFLPQPLSSPGDWQAWLPGCLYLSAAILDFSDGYLARRTATETRLGEFLDTEIDAVGLMVASLFLVWSGRAPWAYLLVGMGYYMLKGAIWIRGRLNQPTHTVSPRPMARLVAGVEMGFAGVALLPIFDAQAMHFAAWVMIAALGEGFMRDWFIVCGWASAAGRPVRLWMMHLERIAAYALPLVLRAAILTAAGRLLAVTPNSLSTSSLFLLQAPMLLICAVGCGLGVAARTAAMVLSFIGANLKSAGWDGADAAVLLVCALMLMITGAGPWRLWQPEDRFFLHKRGSARNAPAARDNRHTVEASVRRPRVAPWSSG
jgi:phosphatidylglycerophosphate synthase